jgi:hypothetical protein
MAWRESGRMVDSSNPHGDAGDRGASMSPRESPRDAREVGPTKRHLMLPLRFLSDGARASLTEPALRHTQSHILVALSLDEYSMNRCTGREVVLERERAATGPGRWGPDAGRHLLLVFRRPRHTRPQGTLLRSLATSSVLVASGRSFPDCLLILFAHSLALYPCARTAHSSMSPRESPRDAREMG